MPQVGEHTIEVLEEYGISKEKITSYLGSNAIKQRPGSRL